MNSNRKSIFTALILAFATLFALGLLFASGPQETEASSISGPTFGGGFNCVSSTYDIDFHFECRDSNTNNLISCDWDIVRQCTLKSDGFYHNDFKSSWYADRCWSGSGTGSTFDFCPGGCNMDWKVDVSKTNYVSLASYYPGGDGVSGKVCSLGSNCPLLFDLNGTVASWTVKLTPSCTNLCTAGAKQCSGNTVQECRDTNSDGCTDSWVDIQTCTANATWCSGADLCSSNTGCWGGACYDNADTCSFNATCNQGTILGRIWVDANMNGGYDDGEGLVQDGASCGAPSSFTLAGTNIQYSGASTGTVKPNACDPPHYITGQITAGDYTVRVSPPEDWAAVAVSGPGNWTKNPDKSITGNLPPWSGDTANWKHVWFGINRKPIAEASGAKTIAGPWADKVYITNVNPDVDKSKNWDFVLSALKDITGDGLASRDPKGGPITCTWAYDIDKVAATTFTGCELGDDEYTEAKHQEMVDYYKAKPEGTYGAWLTVTDQYGLTDTDTVTIIKDPPPPPPKVDLLVVDDQCGTGADLGIPKNVITWSASGTTSYELKACIDADCTTIDSGPFVKNPNTFTHKAEDGVIYSYIIVVHGPGGDSSSSTLIQARNCKGAISLTVYFVDDNGLIYFPIPEATVKLTNTSGTTVIKTATTDDFGMAHFTKLIPGTYGVLAYKNTYKGIAKQAGDCDAAQYSIAGASIGPNAITQGLQAAWDNNVPVIEGRTTWCHDLGLAGIPPLRAVCSASPDPAEVNKPVTWTADVVGGEKAGKTYSYSWTGDDGLSGAGKTITKTYTTTGVKTALETVTSGDETSTEICAVSVVPPLLCDPSEFPKNDFKRCFYDYDFGSSPSVASLTNGKLLNVGHELVADQFVQISSVVAIDDAWGTGMIIPRLSKGDKIGGVWQAEINFKPEEFKFIVDADDGVELTVDLNGNGSLADEAPIINEWHNFDQEVSGHYETAGYYPLNGYRKVRLRWFENTGDAKIKLTWYNKTCHMLDLDNKLHVCFWKGTTPGAGEFIGERDDAFFRSPAAIFEHPIDKNYGFGGESGIVNNFSGRWRGIVNFEPGLYTFKVETNDGVRLDVDDDGIYEINEWSDHEGIHETSLIPAGGETPVRLEWYENEGEANIQFFWTKRITFLERVGKLFASLLSLVML